MSLPPTSPDTTKAPDQRPEHPDFWDKRFDAGTTPWDAGRVPQDLADFCAAQTTPWPTLIPGCGSAWEAVHLAERGWPVTALDFSPVAVDRARQIIGRHAVTLCCADFFNFTPPADGFRLIYERAFLCALPRKLWAEWATRCAELLPPGGLLAGFFFVCEQAKGPPFGILPAQLEALLTPNFERLADQAVNDSIAVFAGRERWQLWRRR